ncbi:hypothetical protein [Subtercola sp. YIM 133946]|uniref:hypothetical protein n=1 Tax=Subtercola sp. YIM 133946 TaxID=3118909 RepID=UPI002F93B17A
MTYDQPTPPPRRPLTALWIALGSIGFLALTAIGVIVTIAGANTFGQALGRAATPQFSAADASAVLLTPSQGDRFGTWAAPQTESTVVGDAQSQLQDSWQNDSPQPSSLPCEFAYSLYPVTNLETGSQQSQPVELNDQFVSIGDNSSISQSTRVFASSAEASAYISSMRTLIDGCSSYATASWSATVAPLPLDSVSLNSAGWAETGTGDAAGASYFAADVQRGNVVTRLTGEAAVGDEGALDAALFTSVVDVAASNLAQLKPGAGAAAGQTSV